MQLLGHKDPPSVCLFLRKEEQKKGGPINFVLFPPPFLSQVYKKKLDLDLVHKKHEGHENSGENDCKANKNINEKTGFSDF